MDHPGPYENRSAHFMKDCYPVLWAFEQIVSRGSAQRITLKMRSLVIKRSIVLRALVVTMLLMGVVLISPIVAHASSTTTYQTAVPATFATGVQNLSNPYAGFNAISCASAGNCTVAGQFEDAAGYNEAFTQSETNGVWGTSAPATFAPGVQNASPDDNFSAISCASAGNCTAVGQFEDAAGYNEAFTQSETNGVWGTSAPATFAPGVQNTIDPNADFNAVSCASAGNCTVAGQFLDAAYNYEAFTQSETNGVWALSVPATFASGVQGLSSSDAFTAISCASAGNCTAAGYFYDAAGFDEAFTQSETNGIWALSVPASFASGVQNFSRPWAGFTAISCASAGNCTAAGQFVDAFDYNQAFTQSLTTPLPVTPTTAPATTQATTSNLAATGSSTSQLIEGAVVMTGLGIAGVAMSRRRRSRSLGDALR